MRADVHRFSLSDPGDVSGLRAAIEAGRIDPATIVAVIGKTPGNGLVNDYTRGYLTLSLALLIGETTGETPDAVRARVPFVFSGGTEGVLSPHYAVFTAVPSDEQPNGGKTLGVGVVHVGEVHDDRHALPEVLTDRLGLVVGARVNGRDPRDAQPGVLTNDRRDGTV